MLLEKGEKRASRRKWTTGSVLKSKLILISGILCLFPVILLSCNKSKDPEPTQEQLLTDNNGWKLTALTAAYAGGRPVDLFYSLYDCQKDNLYLFRATGVYIQDEGATKCGRHNPQVIETGIWTFNDDNTILTLTPSGADPKPATITLTPTTLIATVVDTVSSRSAIYTQTFTAQ